jgi:hypothetical protein
MPRNKIKVSYRKAAVTPSKRQREIATAHPSYIPELKQPKGLSPLAQYLKDNEGCGISANELITQFQEYDCEHPNEIEEARGPTKITYACPDCGRVRFVERVIK